MSLKTLTKHLTADFVNGAYAGLMRFDPKKVPSDLKTAKSKANYRAGYLFGYAVGGLGKLALAAVAARYGIDLGIAATA